MEIETIESNEIETKKELETISHEISEKRNTSEEVKNYLQNINNNDVSLVIYNNELNKDILMNEINTLEIKFKDIECSSENLFECLITEKSVPLIIINNFSPLSHDNETIKIINILDSLLSYGQSIIITTKDDNMKFYGYLETNNKFKLVDN